MITSHRSSLRDTLCSIEIHDSVRQTSVALDIPRTTLGDRRSSQFSSRFTRTPEFTPEPSPDPPDQLLGNPPGKPQTCCDVEILILFMLCMCSAIFNVVLFFETQDNIGQTNNYDVNPAKPSAVTGDPNLQSGKGTDNYFVVLPPHPENMKKMGHKDLINFIETSLLPSAEHEWMTKTYLQQCWVNGYKGSKLKARIFIRYVQVIMELFDTMPWDALCAKYHPQFQKRGEEKRFNDTYLKLLVEHNKVRRKEFDRVLKTLSKPEEAKKYGSLPLDELQSSGYKRDGFSKPNWKRPRHFKIFPDREIRYEDVFQCKVGDCGLMSSIAALACHKPDFVREMITDKGQGLYAVKLCFASKKSEIIVDSFFPERIFQAFNKDVQYHFGFLIEKAFASYHKSYDGLTSFYSGETAMKCLSGYPTKSYKEEFPAYEKLVQYFKQGYSITMSLTNYASSDENHAVSIAGFDKRNGVQYVHIFNQHNKSQEDGLKDLEGSALAKCKFVKGKKNTLEVPYNEQILNASFVKEVNVLIFDRKLRSTVGKSSNQGKPGEGHDMIKVIVKQETEIYVTIDQGVGLTTKQTTLAFWNVIDGGFNWELPPFAKTVKPGEYELIPCTKESSEMKITFHIDESKVTIGKDTATEETFLGANIDNWHEMLKDDE